MDLYTVTIDDKEIQIAPNATVLEAAVKAGVEIPTLCFHPSLQPEGACRICIVEMCIEKQGAIRTWMDAACVYPVQDGLKVCTNSPQVRKERKVILELLLSRAPDSRLLNELAEKYGADKNRFQAIDKGKANCILCGLCVRVCSQLLQTGGIGTAFRGVHKKIVSPLKIASGICTGCTACSLVCPAGAIEVYATEDSVALPAWEVKVKMLLCASCGKPFAPAPLIEELQRKVSVKAETMHRCPECRRKAFMEAVKI